MPSKERRSRGKNARSRGHAAERRFFENLNEELGTTYFKRNLDQTRNGGADDDPTHHAFPVAVEVKYQKNLSIGTWIRQAKEQATAVDKTPVLAVGQPNEPWRIFVELTVDQFVRYLHHTLEIKNESIDINAYLAKWARASRG
jgi:hypothetical protein